MKVLVTGHLGFIGSVMTRILQERGHETVGLDTGYFTDCHIVDELHPPVREIHRDIRAVEKKDLEGIEAIVHLAALSNDPMGEFDPELTRSINFLGTTDLAEKAREAGVCRFLFASSCSMYGAADTDSALDETAAFNPVSAYAVSKVEAEGKLTTLADDHFSPVFLRNATAYGFSPRPRLGTLVLNNLVGWAVTTGKILIKSDGTPWRPLVHVEDICGACAAALEAPRETVHNEAFNIGLDSENYQVRDIANIVKEVVPGCEVEITGEVQADQRSYRVDFKKVREQLPGFQPKWDAKKGVEQMYLFMRDAGLTFEQFHDRRYTRLEQLKYLIDNGQIDTDLRWIEEGK